MMGGSILVLTGVSLVFLVLGYVNLKADRLPEGAVYIAGSIIMANFAQAIFVAHCLSSNQSGNKGSAETQ